MLATKTQLIELIKRHRGTLRGLGVARLGLFGSVARGTQDDESDLDVLAVFQPDKKTFDNFMCLAEFLEDLSGRRVEVVTPESLSPYLGPRILENVEYVDLGD